MPEPHLPDLPDLATPAARETIPPPFSTIVDRARRRRRRTVLVVAAATTSAVAAAAISAVLSLGNRDAAPQPAHPSPATPSPTSSTTPEAPETKPDATTIVQGGDLVSVAAGGVHTSLLTVWQLCGEGGGCRRAWQLQAPAGTYRGLAGGSVPVAYAAGDMFLVTSWNKPGVVIDLAGRARQITEVASGRARAGDVIVRHGKGLAVVDPMSARLWRLPDEPDTDDWAQGAVGADGTIWAMSSAGGASRISWSTDGEHWQHHVMPSDSSQSALPGYLAVSSDHVAAVSGYDGATVLPVADLAVTSDGGRTWTDLHQTDLPFDYIDAVAATSGGTLYVVTPGGEHLYRSVDDTWTRFVEVPNPKHVDSLVPAGDQVIGRSGTTLLAFDDDGHADTAATFD